MSLDKIPVFWHVIPPIPAAGAPGINAGSGDFVVDNIGCPCLIVSTIKTRSFVKNNI